MRSFEQCCEWLDKQLYLPEIHIGKVDWEAGFWGVTIYDPNLGATGMPRKMVVTQARPTIIEALNEAIDKWEFEYAGGRDGA